MAIVRRENAPTRTWDLDPTLRDFMNEFEPLFGELARPIAPPHPVAPRTTLRGVRNRRPTRTKARA